MVCVAWTGILFRGMTAGAELDQARRLVQTVGLPVPDDAAATWFGLWDLSAAEGADLLAAAAIRPAGPGVVELAAFAVSASVGYRDHGHRLLHEVLDRMRAAGADRLVAPLPASEGERALLLAAGFRPVEPAQGAERADTRLFRDL